jgi:putative PD-(D/E)XK family protein DUF4420
MTAFRTLLHRLRTDGSTNSDLEVPSIETSVHTGFGVARVAIGKDNAARLLLPVSRSERPIEIEKMDSLQVSISKFNISDTAGQFIELVCRQSDLETVFAELAEEILRRVEQGETPASASVATISEFKSLLDSDGVRSKATLAEVQGLLAELLHLKRLTRYSTEAVKLWLGPTGDRNDFRGGDIAIEVKSSSRASNPVLISSIDQLELPEGDQLFLARYILDRNDAGGLTIARLYHDLISTGVNSRILAQRLAEIGYDETTEIQWNRFGFNPQGTHIFRVTNGFPCLNSSAFVGGRIPSGIQSIKYEIDLGCASDFQLDDSEISKVEAAICRSI